MTEKNNNAQLYEILKLKLKDFDKNNTLVMDDDKLKKHRIKNRTLVKESELIRIIKHLNPENCQMSESGFPFLKDIISVDIKVSVYRDMTTGIINFNGTNYKRLLSSSGNVRNKKVFFINEDLYEKVNKILLCGMPEDMEFDIFAKFSAYYALVNTDSTPVPMPNMIVVDDYVHSITEKFDLVKEIGKDKYVVENNVKYTTKIKPFDGAGLVDASLAEIWAKKLGLDYIPSAFQFRAIPGLKGNLYTFDIKAFAKEHGRTKIVDMWGKEWDIENDGINCILTKSQFKFYKKFNSFKDWLDSFNEDTYGYRRKFNISKVAEKVSELPRRKPLSYQPLQSLELDEEQIKTLCADTVEALKRISTDVDSFLEYRGLVAGEEDDDENNSIDVPEYYKALKKNKDLFYDDWIQKVEGNYQTFIPDIYGLAEYAFGLPVKGLLGKDQVYSNYWLNKGVKVIDIIRYPHIAMEHKISEVVSPAKMQYYKYITEGIVTNLYDSTALKLNGADFDNDKVLTTSNKILIAAARKNMSNTILYIPMEKDGDGKEVEMYKINNMERLIKTDVDGMSNSIGEVVNKITKLWSLPQTEKVKDYIKIMSVVGSLTIDFVKTGIKAEIPNEIEEFLEKVKKPYFMRYIKTYHSYVTKEKRINNNNEILGEEEERLFDNRDCTMNRICRHMEQQVGKINLEKCKGQFDWASMLAAAEPYIYNHTYPKVLKLLKALKKEHDQIAQRHIFEEYNMDERQENGYRYDIFYGYAKAALLKICPDLDKLIDYVVYAFYADADFGIHNSDKAILWNCFGEEINKRLDGQSNKKQIDVDKLIKKAQKMNAKRKKIKAGDKKVIIGLFKDKRIAAKVTKAEIKYIKEKLKDPEARKLSLILLVLEKACRSINCKVFEIRQGDKTKITKTHVCKLAGISDLKYKKLMSLLNQNGVIELKKSNNGVTLECDVLFKNDNDVVVIEIHDINDCRKYFKKIS
ncbi:MAG: hypothetical protein JG777_2879 [Clostridia bacterium]|nr:hypothetical protein [Clostridia bacterium]